jgi:hypothetical protein
MTMRPARPATLAALAAAALLAAGCGVKDPYAGTAPATTAATTAAQSPANPGEGGPGTVTAGAGAGPATRTASSPRAALAAFATASINWTWQTLAATDRRLAGMSIGPVQQQELQAAAQVAADATLRSTKTTNQGHVVAIAPASGEGAGTYVVVTREQSGSESNAALATAPAIHVVLAQVARQGSGWAVSAWRPQS